MTVDQATVMEDKSRAKSCLMKNTYSQLFAINEDHSKKRLLVNQEVKLTKVLEKDRHELIDYAKDLRTELDFCKAKVQVAEKILKELQDSG